MTYLTRPVFDFAVDWIKPVTRSILYDLREEVIGFGSSFFTPTETHPRRGWDIGLTLDGADQVDAFEAFFDGVTGGLIGFWLPAPQRSVVISGGVSTTQFDIVDQGLAGLLAGQPELHLWFLQPDGSTAAAKVQGVVDNGNGTERITLTGAIAFAPDTTTTVKRLLYARRVGDDEEYVSRRENCDQLVLRLRELPLEYAAAETGRLPIFLYHFWMDAPVDVHWRYTSFASRVGSGNFWHEPWPINHGAIKQSLEGVDHPVSLSMKADASAPIAVFFPVPPGRPMRIEIHECSVSAPETRVLRFTGEVRDPEEVGGTVRAQCVSGLYPLLRKVPRFMVQERCNYQLYEPNTCRTKRRDFETTITFVEFGAGVPAVVTVGMAYPELEELKGDPQTTEDWFKGGLLETGRKTHYEVRSIIHSEWDAENEQLLLTINIPFAHAQVGQWCQITAGCDRLFETCKAKFSNSLNFGGARKVPVRNLSLQALNAVASRGDKK